MIESDLFQAVFWFKTRLGGTRRYLAVNRADTVRPYDEGIVIRADAANRADTVNGADTVRPYDEGIIIRVDAF